MNMIFYEVLRLYPPLPVLYRVTNADSKLGNITLSGGVDVIVPLLSLHVDKDLWGDDALEFKPERFKDRDSERIQDSGSLLSIWWWATSMLEPEFCIR